MKKIVKIYVHRNKESNYDTAQQIGIVIGSQAEKTFSYTACEVELAYEVDLSTGHAVLIGADGYKLSNEYLEDV